MTEDEERKAADRVAEALAGKFYVGQLVRISGAWLGEGVGEEATIVSYVGKNGLGGDTWRLDRPIVSAKISTSDGRNWHEGFLEPV